jgi:hypothetical protein
MTEISDEVCLAALRGWCNYPPGCDLSPYQQYEETKQAWRRAIAAAAVALGLDGALRRAELAEGERDALDRSHADLGRRLADAGRELEQLRAHLKEADQLLDVAYYAHQKMGLEGEGNHGYSHEVRMFASHFSRAETPRTPQHTILSGDGRYWRFRLRDHEQKEDKP